MRTLCGLDFSHFARMPKYAFKSNEFLAATQFHKHSYKVIKNFLFTVSYG